MGRRCPKGYLFQIRIDYCTLFSTFDMDKLNKSMERTPLTSLKVGFVENQRSFAKFYRRLYGEGRAQTCFSPSPPSTYKSLSILATLQSYIFARLRRITFSFGNVTATEIKIKLLLVLSNYWMRLSMIS